jgi:5-(carboxyamino)imidazole ribonucleotide synthase
MLALAAARLGYRCHVFCPDADAPAAQVSERSVTAAYEDFDALAAFAAGVDVVTYEFENVPASAAAFVDRRVPLRPSAHVLATCQDRVAEKSFLNRIGIATTAWRQVDRCSDLSGHLAAIRPPAILKAARYGYDGKAQTAIDAERDAEAAWARVFGGGHDGVAILEAKVDFEREISVIVGRNVHGEVASYVAVENLHVNHILKRTIAPASIPCEMTRNAEAIGRRIAEALDLVGVLAVEMFVGGDGQLLVNELAPRPHNSGHWTIDACMTSQFEQCVRAICGLPLGSTEPFFDAVMENLLGDEIEGALACLSEANAKVHIYGKACARPGRKMGHVTRLFPRGDTEAPRTPG